MRSWRTALIFMTALGEPTPLPSGRGVNVQRATQTTA